MELRLSFSQQLAKGLRGGGHQLTDLYVIVLQDYSTEFQTTFNGFVKDDGSEVRITSCQHINPLINAQEIIGWILITFY